MDLRPPLVLKRLRGCSSQAAVKAQAAGPIHLAAPSHGTVFWRLVFWQGCWWEALGCWKICSGGLSKGFVEMA